MARIRNRAVIKPADARQRAAALDLSRSFIVQAPAGSGKTELLTQRFLKLLARVDRPERILAITFTRKATREMRERIMRRLKQADHAAEVLEDHERLAVELAGQALQHAAALGWNLLENPGRLRIHTIDGLCTQLLARDPQRGSHMAGRSLRDDPKPLYRHAVHRLFKDLGGADAAPAGLAAAGEALVRLLVHLDGNTQAVGDLLVAMLGVRDQWTRKIGTGSAAIAAVLQDRQQQELRRFMDALGADRVEAAMGLVARLGDALEDRDCAAGAFADEVAAARSERGAPGAESDSAAAAVRRAHLFSRLFMTVSGTPRAPGGITKSLFTGLPDELSADIPRLKAIYTDWHASDDALDVLQRMATTPPLDGAGISTGLRDDIRVVLMQALAQLHVLFAEQGTADFQFMTESALQCLGDGDDPGQVLLEEDLRLEHILMDEFQDTSNTQFELLSRLLAGWEQGGARSLFLVGDPMQSIYRFREANVGLFIDVVQSCRVASIALSYLRLESNFRSRSEVVNWVNDQFSRIFPARDQRDSGAVSYAPARPAKGRGGCVQVHPLAPDSSDADEALAAVALIRSALQADATASIAVLARARGHLAPLARELLRQDIVFEAVKVDALATRPVVGDLLAITRALVHAADRVAWLALLRAPWCGLTMDELHRLAGEDGRADLLERIGQVLERSGATGLCSASLQRLQHLYQVLRQALRRRGSHSLVHCVEYTWLHLRGPCACASTAELENAATFLHRLGALEREDSEDLVGRLTEQLQDLYAASTPSRLQLMTIHQAKGLEFDVVIIPGLHRVTGKNDPPLVALQEFRTAQGRDTALLAALPARGVDGPTVYHYLTAVDKERSGYETQRLLYVATTRAKSQLHLLGRYRQDKNGQIQATRGTLLAMLLPVFIQQLNHSANGDQPAPQQGLPDAAAGDAASDSDGQPRALPLLRLDKLPEWPVAPASAAADRIDRPEAVCLHDLPAREAAALGAALHQWLELIHDHRHRDWSADWFLAHPAALTSSLRRAGVDEDHLEALLPSLRHMLIQATTSPSGRAAVGLEAPALAGVDGDWGSWAELMLYRREGYGISRHIIDRLYRQEDGAWVIIDYKSGTDRDTSRALWADQLSRYRQLIESLDCGAVARTLIYQTTENTIVDLSQQTVTPD